MSSRTVRHPSVGLASILAFWLLSGCGISRSAADPLWGTGYAPAPKDAAAKTFAPPPGKAEIYLFEQKGIINWIFGMRSCYGHVRLDGKFYGDFGWNGYFHWVVEPGEHAVLLRGFEDAVAHPLVLPFIGDLSAQFFPQTLSIVMREGDTIFIEGSWEMKGLNGVKSNLLIVDACEGRAAIERRRLVADRD